jgi:hypothetical protein
VTAIERLAMESGDDLVNSSAETGEVIEVEKEDVNAGVERDDFLIKEVFLVDKARFGATFLVILTAFCAAGLTAVLRWVAFARC